MQKLAILFSSLSIVNSTMYNVQVHMVLFKKSVFAFPSKAPKARYRARKVKVPYLLMNYFIRIRYMRG
jgi:hypothetical protein